MVVSEKRTFQLRTQPTVTGVAGFASRAGVVKNVIGGRGRDLLVPRARRGARLGLNRSIDLAGPCVVEDDIAAEKTTTTCCECSLRRPPWCPVDTKWWYHLVSGGGTTKWYPSALPEPSARITITLLVTPALKRSSPFYDNASSGSVRVRQCMQGPQSALPAR